MSAYKPQKLVAVCPFCVDTTSMRVQLIHSGACGDCLAPAASLPLIVLSRLLQSWHTWPVVWNELVKVLGQVTACPEAVRGVPRYFEPNSEGCLETGNRRSAYASFLMTWCDMTWHLTLNCLCKWSSIVNGRTCKTLSNSRFRSRHDMYGSSTLSLGVGVWSSSFQQARWPVGTCFRTRSSFRDFTKNHCAIAAQIIATDINP
jgi:hypothetical protein